jgi:ubiquinone/menaquinone biosynthesis C-methylase UbiE
LIGDVRGQHVCDLACGQGRIARALAQQGASVVGVDVSTELIAIAQRDAANDMLPVRHVVDDVTILASQAPQSFDGVVCNMALMDIPDLHATFMSVYRTLRLSGWCVFSITHPCFQSPHAARRNAEDGTISREVFSYFNEGFWRSTYPHGVRGQVGAQYRMLSTYLNALVQAGFRFEQLREPQATDSVQAQIPGYAVVPAFLVMRCVKLIADS